MSYPKVCMNQTSMFIGKVIHGDGIGRGLGFPTANLDTSQDTLALRAGVYAARSFLLGKEYAAALAIQETPWKCELHLLDFEDSNLYGENIEVEVVEKVSEMVAGLSKEDLAQKIDRDVERVKELLGK